MGSFWSSFFGRDRNENPTNDPPPRPNPEPPELGEGDGHNQNEEEEGEGEDEQLSDTGQDDAPASEDEREETFSPTLIRGEIEPPVVLEQSFLDKAKANQEAIDEVFGRISAICKDIGNLQKGFRQRLRVDEGALLSQCFKSLRSLVGPYDRDLSLNEETHELNEDVIIVMSITIGEDAGDDAKEAVTKFNLMLERCKEFQEERREAERIIEEKITALELDSVQTQATLKVVEIAKRNFDSLHTWQKDIERILADTRSASKYLLPRNTTGLKFIIED